MGTKPEPDTTSLHDEYAEYDALIRTLVSEYAREAAEADDDDAALPPLTMVDVSPGFEALGNPDSLYQDDELHLSSEGYSYWEEWASLALETPDCVLWESGACSCADDDAWHYAGKSNKLCSYVAKKVSPRNMNVRSLKSTRTAPVFDSHHAHPAAGEALRREG